MPKPPQVPTPDASLNSAVGVRRVRKAHEQVADQLRELITSGEVAVGTRLPNESLLAHEFGVSRATVREALRVLAAWNLIRTTKGTGGGSYVTMPTVDHISEFLSSSVGLLSESRHVELEEFLEARQLIEVAAARLAASRAEAEDIEHLLSTIPSESANLDSQQRYLLNKDFHASITRFSKNTVLYIAAQPIFFVLQAHLARSAVSQSFYRGISEQHGRIAKALEAGDADGAAAEMDAHLRFLRPMYERIWPTTRRS